MQVSVRDARAFSCVGSGVDDLRLVHAAGGVVGRLPGSALTCVSVWTLSPSTVLAKLSRGGVGRAELAQSTVALGE